MTFKRTDSFFVKVDLFEYQELIYLAELAGFATNGYKGITFAKVFSINFTTTKGKIFNGVGYNCSNNNGIKEIYRSTPEKMYQEARDFFNYFIDLSNKKEEDKMDETNEDKVFIKNRRVIHRQTTEEDLGYISIDGLFCVTGYAEFSPSMLRFILGEMEAEKSEDSEDSDSLEDCY